jgi:hypothetical protein
MATPISPSPQIWHAKAAILRSPISIAKADYGPLNGLSTDLVKLNSIGERRGKPRQRLTVSEAGDVSICDLHAQVV